MAKVGEDYSYILVRPHASMADLDGPIMQFILLHLVSVQVSIATSYHVGNSLYQFGLVREYAEHREKPFYSKLMLSMTADFENLDPEVYAPVIIVQAKEKTARPVWEIVHEICGPKDAAELPPEDRAETIRGKFGTPGANLVYNVVHCPDSLEAVKAFEEHFVRPGARGSHKPPLYE